MPSPEAIKAATVLMRIARLGGFDDLTRRGFAEEIDQAADQKYRELLEAAKAVAWVKQDVISVMIAGRIPGWQKIDTTLSNLIEVLAKLEVK